MTVVAARCSAPTMPLARPLVFGVALAYLLTPGHPLAPLSGLPLGATALAVSLAIASWAVALPGAPPRAPAAIGVLAALAVAKLAVGWLAPAYGMLAEYRVGGGGGPVERSTEWRGIAGTRVDAALAFRGAEFPVHFFNDVRRFNYFTANEPKRDLLPFEARWTGSFWAREAGRYRLAVEANGGATLSLAGLATPDGGPLAVESGQRVREASAVADLGVGLHPLVVTYRRPAEGIPW